MTCPRRIGRNLDSVDVPFEGLPVGGTPHMSPCGYGRSALFPRDPHRRLRRGCDAARSEMCELRATMKKMLKPVLAVVSVLCVTGAHAEAGSASPKPKELTRAVHQFLEDHGDLCLGHARVAAQVTPEDRKAGSNEALQMPVLERLGVVQSEEIGSPSSEPAKRYSLTAKGRQFFLRKKRADTRLAQPAGSARRRLLRGAPDARQGDQVVPARAGTRSPSDGGRVHLPHQGRALSVRRRRPARFSPWWIASCAARAR